MFGSHYLLFFYRTTGFGFATAFGKVYPHRLKISTLFCLYPRATFEKWAEGVAMIIEDNLCSPLDARNAEGRTALHEAAALGEENIIFRLLEKGANINSKDSNGVTPLYVSTFEFV